MDDPLSVRFMGSIAKKDGTTTPFFIGDKPKMEVRYILLLSLDM